MASRSKRKRCTSCGTVASIRPGVRKCRQVQPSPSGWGIRTCGGRLETVEREPRQLSVQQKARAARRGAEAKVEEYTAAVISNSRLLDKWRRKVAYYKQREGLTDEQLATARQQREAAQSRRRDREGRRGIAVRTGERL